MEDATSSSPSAETDVKSKPKAKPLRLAKIIPELASKGLVRGTKSIRVKKPGTEEASSLVQYYELWLTVPKDYTLKNGSDSKEERSSLVTIPIRILQVTPTPTSIDELLIPSQDIGKMVGIRPANVSKDIIAKICGRGESILPIGSIKDWGRFILAPTPSNSKHSEFQPQKCIRVDKVLAFLRAKAKPAGVDKVLTAGLKSYPLSGSGGGGGGGSDDDVVDVKRVYAAAAAATAAPPSVTTTSLDTSLSGTFPLMMMPNLADLPLTPLSLAALS
jgi:hypothetical protein